MSRWVESIVITSFTVKSHCVVIFYWKASQWWVKRQESRQLGWFSHASSKIYKRNFDQCYEVIRRLLWWKRSQYHSKLNNSKTTGYRFVHSTSGAWNLQPYCFLRNIYILHIPFQKASTKSFLTKKKRPPSFGGWKNPRIQETNGPSPQWIPPATSKRHTLRRWWSSFPWSPAARWDAHQQMSHVKRKKNFWHSIES